MTLEQARAHMSVLAADLARNYPQTNRGSGVFVEPMLNDMTGSVRNALLLLLAAVGVLFLRSASTWRICSWPGQRVDRRNSRFEHPWADAVTTRSTVFCRNDPVSHRRRLSRHPVGALVAGALDPSATCEHPAYRRDRCARSGAGRIDGPVRGRGLRISLAPAAQIHSHLERGPAAAGRARGLFS